MPEITPFSVFLTIVVAVCVFFLARHLLPQRDHEVDPPGPAGDVVRGQREAKEAREAEKDANWMDGEDIF